MQREMAASRASESQSSAMSPPTSSAPSTSPVTQTLPPPSPGGLGLLSSLTSSLTASTSSASLLSSSPSPQKHHPSGNDRNRRLLTSRHSISHPSPSKTSSWTTQHSSYTGGMDLSLQDSPTPEPGHPLPDLAAAGAGQGYDVSKMAKSWFGGVMKSASTVLDTFAPVQGGGNSSADLGTVREEEEEEEEEQQEYEQNTDRQRTQHHHQYAAHGADIDGRTSLSTTGSESPNSSHDDDEADSRFSMSNSRSSSVSSIQSGPSSDGKDEHVGSHHGESKMASSSSDKSMDTVKSDRTQGQLEQARRPSSSQNQDDVTPVATPVLPQSETPKAATGACGKTRVDEEDAAFWGLDGFEDAPARETRERAERERMHGDAASPPRAREIISSVSPKQYRNPARTAGNAPPPATTAPSHGRRRSTAFELGGAWGSLVGKKFSEMANSET